MDVMANNESLDEQLNYDATAKKDGKRCVVTSFKKTNARGWSDRAFISFQQMKM